MASWADFSSPIAALITTAGNYAMNAATNQTNLQIQRETNQSNRALAEMQNQWNLDMWNRQNEYNDPSAQVERLKAAGINPALAYSNGAMMNEAAPAAEAVGSRDAAAHMQAYYMDPLTMAQVANLNADTDKKKSETETEDQLREARYNQLVTLTRATGAQVEDILSKIEQRKHENALTDANRENIAFDQTS